jgi:hypothetical protein
MVGFGISNLEFKDFYFFYDTEPPDMGSKCIEIYKLFSSGFLHFIDDLYRRHKDIKKIFSANNFTSL